MQFQHATWDFNEKWLARILWVVVLYNRQAGCFLLLGSPMGLCSDFNRLSGAPFESLKEGSFKHMLWRTGLMLVFVSVKHVSDIHAHSCTQFVPHYTRCHWNLTMLLCPQCLAHSFQLFWQHFLQTIVIFESQQLHVLCPVRTLYMDRTMGLGNSVSRANSFKSRPITKQQFSRWTVGAIALADTSQGQQLRVNLQACCTHNQQICVKEF